MSDHNTNPPAQHAQDEIHHKECPEDHHGDEVHELPGAALGVVDLKHQVRSSSKEENEWIF